MVTFENLLGCGPAENLGEILKNELKTLKPGDLPLQMATQQGGLIDDKRLEPTVLGVSESQDAIMARVGIFFTEIVAGCNCGDDPMPVNSYCELEVRIDKHSAEAKFRLISDH